MSEVAASSKNSAEGLTSSTVSRDASDPSASADSAKTENPSSKGRIKEGWKKTRAVLRYIRSVLLSIDVFHYKVPKSLHDSLTDGHPELLPIKEVRSWWGFLVTLSILLLLSYWIYSFIDTFFKQFPITKAGTFRTPNGHMLVPSFGLSIRQGGFSEMGPVMQGSAIYNQSLFQWRVTQVSVSGTDQSYSYADVTNMIADCTTVNSDFIPAWLLQNSQCLMNLDVEGTQNLASEQFYYVDLVYCNPSYSSVSGVACLPRSTANAVLANSGVIVTVRQHGYPDDNVYRFNFQLSPGEFALDSTFYFYQYSTQSEGRSLFLRQSKKPTTYVLFSREHSYPSYNLMSNASILLRLAFRQEFFRSREFVHYEGWSDLGSRIGGIIFFFGVLVAAVSIAYNQYLFKQENPNFGKNLSDLIWRRAGKFNEAAVAETNKIIEEKVPQIVEVANTGESRLPPNTKKVISRKAAKARSTKGYGTLSEPLIENESGV
eukprot:ANDGO_05202.mRNA.1 hypothetical protein